jgi:murein DD-endopeptidase MepM/ murein hydrolase activator NlpD
VPVPEFAAHIREARSAFLLAMVLFAALPATAENTPLEPKKAQSWSISSQPTKLVNGAPVVFQVTSHARLESLSGKWLEHDVFFFRNPKSNTWYGFAGISLVTRPGTYPLALKGNTARGMAVSVERKFTIRSAKYPSIAVTVAKQFTQPSPEQQQQIKQDKELKDKLFAQVTPEREWAGKFHPPVSARVSDVFGTRRTFNGKTQSTHQGLDYAVPKGTAVSAINAGTVLLARPLFFEGTCVVLDHGQGLLTLYMHLSEIKVKEGERVSPGQELGLSGGSGRATGPHLHVAVRWQGVYLNPATLLSLKLP